MSTETTSILENESRNGNFTSSEIVALTTSNRKGDDFGEPALTYITEKRFERILGCSLGTETDARATSWGKALEGYVFDCVLSMDYTITSTETDKHPTITCWSGSKDGTNEKGERAVIDIKCPFTKKSYMSLIIGSFLGLFGIEAMNAIRFGFTHNGVAYPKHKDGEKYYWQLVSNAILNNCKFAELLPFMPRQSDLLLIRNHLVGNPLGKFLEYMNDAAIPCLPNDSPVKSLYVIRFEVPQADIDFLTKRALKGEKLLTI